MDVTTQTRKKSRHRKKHKHYWSNYRNKKDHSNAIQRKQTLEG